MRRPGFAAKMSSPSTVMVLCWVGTTTYLIDNSGNVVYQWELGYTPCHC